MYQIAKSKEKQSKWPRILSKITKARVSNIVARPAKMNHPQKSKAYTSIYTNNETNNAKKTSPPVKAARHANNLSHRIRIIWCAKLKKPQTNKA